MTNLLKNLENIFDLHKAKPGSVYNFSQKTINEASTSLAPFYQAQKFIRPLWGKHGLNEPDMGDHPDFRYLKGKDDTCYNPIVTMFLDITNSTRLGLLYTPDFVRTIKSAIINMGIDIIASFDGHVHRIMGDAVMAYFGGKDSKTENAVIDAINCASVIQYFFENKVSPELNENITGDKVGIRIGIDYGPKDSVLWSSYGYPNAEEVTATSLFVDLASKLQQSAGKNNIMIGQSLKEHLDFPDELLDIKTYNENGVRATKPDNYIRPNYTNTDGKQINYRKWILRWDKYLFFSNLGQMTNHNLLGDKVSPLKVKAEVYDEKYGNKLFDYSPTSKVNTKGNWIKFIATLPCPVQLPATINFKVENHGKEAGTDLKHDYPREITTANRTYERWEQLEYRGLHYMIVEVSNRKGLKFKTNYGVYVK